MTIMDRALHKLIKGDLVVGSVNPENDMQTYFMKEFSERALQRPPFSVSIFDEQNIKDIKEFLYTEFFTVCSLYEYALKPRKELQLRCEPFVPKLPTPEPLLSMKLVEDPKEVEELKEYFGYIQEKEQENTEGEGEKFGGEIINS